ncbi:MAG TPA: hypothetical protein VFG03_19640 [Telluria sp.]|nr:hypothetical protein [Telluria sp.]
MNGMSREELDARFGASQAVTDARINALLERMDAAVARSNVQFDQLVEAIRDIRSEMRSFRIEIRADMDERFRQFVEAGERNRELLRLEYRQQHADSSAQLGEWRLQNERMSAALRAEWQSVAGELRAEGQQTARAARTEWQQESRDLHADWQQVSDKLHDESQQVFDRLHDEWQQVSRELRAEARADLRDFRTTVRNALIASMATSISACLATIFGVAAVVGNMMTTFESGAHMGGAQADMKRQITEVDARLTRSTEDLKRQITEVDVRLTKSTADLKRQIGEVDARLAQASADNRRQFADINRHLAASALVLRDLQQRLPRAARK